MILPVPTPERLALALALGLAVAALAAPPATPAESNEDKLRRLREKIEKLESATPAPSLVPTPAAPPPAATSRPAATPAASPAPKPVDEGLDEDEVLPEAPAFDPELAGKMGFELVAAPKPVKLTYAVAKPRPTEFLEEIQALVKIPGVPGVVPHHRLYQVQGVPRGKNPDGELKVEYKVLSARVSRPTTSGLELVADPAQEGAIVPVAFSALGLESKVNSLPGEDKPLDWLRILLPDKPIKVGEGWRASMPAILGSRQEATFVVYVLKRIVRFRGRDLAIMIGQIQTVGQEDLSSSASLLKVQGQDRVVFDVTDGVLLFREFRLQGSFVKRDEKTEKLYRARIKGLVFEKGIEPNPARLEAVLTLFS